MIVLDVLYVAIATIGVMLTLQVLTFLVVRVLYPPEPKVIYRTVQAPAPPQAPVPVQVPLQMPPPIFTQPAQETQNVQLPEYDIRGPNTTSARMDPVLPDGIQETRPPGT
jgi:hypothetical protein